MSTAYGPWLFDILAELADQIVLSQKQPTKDFLLLLDLPRLPLTLHLPKSSTHARSQISANRRFTISGPYHPRRHPFPNPWSKAIQPHSSAKTVKLLLRPRTAICRWGVWMARVAMFQGVRVDRAVGECVGCVRW